MNWSCPTRPWGAATAITRSGTSPPDLMRLGTIHSHAGVEAFHSLRDWQDERFEDGFHLTIGNLDTDLTLSCSVVVQGVPGPHPPGAPLLSLPHPLGAGAAGGGLGRRSGPESHSPAPPHRVRAVRGSS